MQKPGESVQWSKKKIKNLTKKPFHFGESVQIVKNGPFQQIGWKPPKWMVDNGKPY